MYSIVYISRSVCHHSKDVDDDFTKIENQKIDFYWIVCIGDNGGHGGDWNGDCGCSHNKEVDDDFIIFENFYIDCIY